MTSCAGSSVGDQGPVLRGAVGPAIVVSLCLRAGDGLQPSCCCPLPVADASLHVPWAWSDVGGGA